MTETMMIIIVAGVVIMAFGILCLISIFRAQKETQGFAKRMGAVEKDLSDITSMVSQNASDMQKADENILQFLQKQEEKLADQEAAQKALEAAQVEQAKQVEEAKQAAQAAQTKQVSQPQAESLPPAAELVPEEPEPILQELEPLIEEPAAPAPKPAPAVQAAPVVPATPAPVAPAAPAPASVAPAQVAAAAPDKDFDLDEIDINDLLDDLEDVLPELNGQPELPNLELPKADLSKIEMPKVPEPEPIQPQIQHVDYDIGQSGKKYTASELETLIRE